MDISFHLGRQPILDRNNQLVAYELLFRHADGINQAMVTDDFLATAHVIQNTFTQFGLDKVLGKRLGFINVNADLLLSDVLELLPAQQVVLEILETVEITPRIIDRCIELRGMGFQLALDDIVDIGPQHHAILPHIQYVKLDLLGSTSWQISRAVQALHRYPVKLLAEKIDSVEQRDRCMQLGFDLFQGYFFAKPCIMSGKKPSPSQTALLRLLGLAHSDAENSEIETAFKLSPDLTISLLKLVNAVGNGAVHKIDSVGRAITMLGRRQLARWIQLLVFTQEGGQGGAGSPLAQTAAIRGKLMELLAQKQYPANKTLHEQAFMVGMLSLLDALFNQPLPELIATLNLSDNVRDALLQQQGILGQLLAKAQAMESACPETADPQCPLLALEAMAWANTLGK